MPAPPTLLHGLIDYAGLFPPAKLPMVDAVNHYAGHRRCPQAGVLGRFILPLALLGEFEEARGRLPADARTGWPLSVLAGTDPTADSALLRDFNARDTGARIVSLETKATTPTDVARVTAPLPADLEIWVEIASTGDPRPLLAAIKTAGQGRPAVLGAKIRTGGVTASAFPSPADVARFMFACHAAGIVFKATAGLHHPLRGEYPLTYEPGSPHGMMFGFLNIFLAAALVRAGGSETEVTALLAETDTGALTVSSDGVVWRGRQFDTMTLAAHRRDFARSFGSCSFAEPIEGLLALRWL